MLNTREITQHIYICSTLSETIIVPVRNGCFCDSFVVADFVSFAYPREIKLTHFVAPPLPKKSLDFSGTPLTKDGGAVANMRKDAHLSDRVTEIAFRTQGTQHKH